MESEEKKNIERLLKDIIAYAATYGYDINMDGEDDKLIEIIEIDFKNKAININIRK